MAKARKFKRSLRSNDLKKKPALKISKRRIESVLSVEFIRKETIQKVRVFAKRIFDFANNQLTKNE